MRRALTNLQDLPNHVGLAYDSWAPTGADGKVPENKRQRWLAGLETCAVSTDYTASFKRWQGSFAPPRDRHFELTLVGRLLVGHGNASATDVGITVHHTWGVPYIPGSAIKGLLAHYVEAVYGPDDPSLPPWEQPEPQLERANWQGVTWKGRRIGRGPGEQYRKLFGAPDADEDETYREKGHPYGAARGAVTFQDALYVPGSSAGDQPFVGDVITVHQKGYYDRAGALWPTDYDDPNPVAFLAVRPGARLLFAVSGDATWTKLAEELIVEALEAWGIGAKTSAGYGRMMRQAPIAKRVDALASRHAGGPQAFGKGQSELASGQRIQAVTLEQTTKRGDPLFCVVGRKETGNLHPASPRPNDGFKVGEVYAFIIAATGGRLQLKWIDPDLPPPPPQREHKGPRRPPGRWR